MQSERVASQKLVQDLYELAFFVKVNNAFENFLWIIMKALSKVNTRAVLVGCHVELNKLMRKYSDVRKL